MKKTKPVFTADNRPKDKIKTPGMVEEKHPKTQSLPPHESATPRAIEDAETEEPQLDQKELERRRSETK